MPSVHLVAYPMTAVSKHGHTLNLCLGGGNPRETVTFKKADEIPVLLKAFAAKIAETGKPYLCTSTFDKRSGRKPPGTDKATSLEIPVNRDKAKQESW